MNTQILEPDGARESKKRSRFRQQFHKTKLALVLTACLPVAGQTLPFQDLHVEKKPGKQTGAVVATVHGKVRRITKNAYQAWPVMKGQDALVLVAAPKASGPNHYLLRFYEGATWKRRDLGLVPFASAELSERVQGDGRSTFILSGQEAGEALIIVADADGIRGRLKGTVVPQPDSNTLSYRDSGGGETRTVPLRSLLGTDMAGIYETKQTVADMQYVQFLRDGTAVVTSKNGQFSAGNWSTDGQSMAVVLKDGSRLEWPRTSLTQVDGVPAGSRLVVRLLQQLSSHKAKEGDSVQAVLISPALIDGKIFLPQGSEFSGTITKAHGVGWALRHETAALTLEFNSAKLPDGQTLPIHTRLYQVENSREKVDKGSIQGIRSTGTLGHTAESRVASVAAVDPVAYLFATVSATAALGFAEPEILYPAGTELQVEFTSPLITSKVFSPTVPPLASSPSERDQLLKFVRKLPFRTATQGSNKPSDLTNLVFIGSPEGLRRAFKAAGWVSADQLTAGTTFQTLKSITGNQVYNQAPMSTLLLDERPPIFTLTKTTNTFSSRHHLRVFDPAMRYGNQIALTSSSTQDIGIAFSRQKRTFIHVIDQYIDNERSKVVNDLEFTGCVTAMDLVPRSWVPQDAYNSTGDKLRTDGAIAVLRINDCSNAKTTPTENAVPPTRFERIPRNTVLTLRNDLWRGNLIYQGYDGVKQLRNYLIHKDELKADPGAWQKSDVLGTEFRGVGDMPAERQSSTRIAVDDGGSDDLAGLAGVSPEPSHRWDPPRYEIALQGGYLRYPTLRSEGVGILLTPEPTSPGLPTLGVALVDEVDGGWTAGISLTTNTWRWFSNEFAYHYQRGKYVMGTIDLSEGADPEIVTEQVGLITRQFEYNLLLHLRPPESRWRPYVAVGPALQLISLADSPLRRSSGPFKLGLQNIGILKAAFDFGGTPPLEGGGIFQVGLQYGAGIKFRVHPRLTLRADFRETWSKNPEFIKDSYTDEFFDTEGYDVEFSRLGATSKFRQQRFTFGIAFTF